jgi:heat-inducible transcriptional repressor
MEVSMLDDRKLAVLRAIVEDFVQTSEPVGSKALAEKHSLGVSPATIRNDMAALEDEGLIAQPHTSAGRIPTDGGYRVFVDRLSSVKPLSTPERRAIESFLDGAVDLDDVMQRSVRLLAQLTRQVAIVQYPSLSRSTVRHVEIVPISGTRVMVVLIADTGRVEQRVVDTPRVMSEGLIGDLRDKINSAVQGRRLTEVPSAVSSLADQFPPEDRATVSAVLSVLLETLVERTDSRVVLGGTSNLTRVSEDFHRDVHPVLEALEEHVVLLKLLGEAATPDALNVRIGHENQVEGLARTSVVTSGYGTATDAVATLGVVGPTRMDYSGTMGAVRAVARYLGRIVTEQ